MPLISSNTIVVSLSLFHMTLGFFFLTSPGTINDLPLVNMLGGSMGMPYTPTFDARSAPLALLGAVLFFFGLSDLATISSLPPEVWLVHHWGSQAPLRATLAILACMYCWLFGPASGSIHRPSLFPSSPGGASSAGVDGMAGPMAWRAGGGPGSGYAPSGWPGDGLKNRVFFTFAFVEAIGWFWVWVTVRDERQELLEAKARKGRRMSQHYG